MKLNNEYFIYTALSEVTREIDGKTVNYDNIYIYKRNRVDAEANVYPIAVLNRPRLYASYVMPQYETILVNDMLFVRNYAELGSYSSFVLDDYKVVINDAVTFGEHLPNLYLTFRQLTAEGYKIINAQKLEDIMYVYGVQPYSETMPVTPTEPEPVTPTEPQPVTPAEQEPVTPTKPELVTPTEPVTEEESSITEENNTMMYVLLSVIVLCLCISIAACVVLFRIYQKKKTNNDYKEHHESTIPTTNINL